MRRDSGFTLVELMVAIGIFAVMSAMAFAGLRSVVDTREGVQAQAERMKSIQQAMALIERDFQQIIARGIRDPFGDPREAMLSDDLTDVEFTRAGLTNPLGLVRSESQRVGYRIDDEDMLVRVHWGVLDQQVEPPEYVTEMLEGVTELRFRYMAIDRNWQETWPPPGQPRGSQMIPVAVEMTMELEDLGEIVRLFRIADGPEIGPP
ncbi:MAG: type II secretion system minor pseudopilin GspJ [Ectothiorhodospiraceae bacterium]|nr:type II secretion system minor pseudopilin GspJ [Ectothiorhodospiraceae bacterium]MCH8503061.1 type II secretion system minor pseudopilin GspJ [Ectothiorhodospiraceae bacterium]